jgi:hypothetical protein
VRALGVEPFGESRETTYVGIVFFKTAARRKTNDSEFYRGKTPGAESVKLTIAWVSLARVDINVGSSRGVMLAQRRTSSERLNCRRRNFRLKPEATCSLLLLLSGGFRL